MSFPDAEDWLIAYLGDLAPVYTVTPETITSTVIQVNRIGGTSDFLTDRPSVGVAVLSPSRDEAWQVVEQIRDRVDVARGKFANGQLCDNGRVLVAPQLRPDPNTTLRLVVMTVQLSFRRP